MTTKQISSPKNPLVHRVQDAARGRLADEMVVDGQRLAQDVLDRDLDVLLVATSPRLEQSDGGAALRDRLERRAAEAVVCTEAVLGRMSALTTHQGVLVVVRRPKFTLADVFAARTSPALVVVAAGVRDPGNLGAMVRTAEAAGATGVVALAGGADPFREKAVRGSAGSVLRLPVVGQCAIADLVAAVAERGIELVVAAGGRDVTTTYLDVDYRRACGVVLGAEGDGVPGELRAAAAATVRIPMTEPVESLNVAVATGVVLYEARRQRR